MRSPKKQVGKENEEETDFNQNTRNASQEEKISDNLHCFPADSGLKASQPFVGEICRGGVYSSAQG